MLKEKRGRDECERELRAVKRGTVVRGRELEEVKGRKVLFPSLVIFHFLSSSWLHE